MRAQTTVSGNGRTAAERRFCLAMAWLAVVGAALGCSEPPTGLNKSAGPPQFVASLSSAPHALVYISLPPGSIPNGGDAILRVARTRMMVEAQLVDGGFDPIPIPAEAGDTIHVLVEMTNATSPVTYTFVVSRPTRPVIVRTVPPKQKRDVPLSLAAMVVFSEPMDPTTLTSSAVQLRTGGAAVAGRLEFTDPDHMIARFVPAALLAPESTYELVVSESLRDVDGMSLESTVTVPFTTGTKSLTFSIQPMPRIVARQNGFAVLMNVQVIARSAEGTIATDFSSDVTIALAPHVTGGTLFPPKTTVRAVEGIATFVDVNLNALGEGHALTATAEGFGVAYSGPFDAGGALFFLNPPTAAFAGVSLVPVEVLARDAAGRAVYSFNAALTLSASAGAPELLGTTRVAAGMFGKAVFSDLQFTQAASDGVQFIVSSDRVTGDTTSSFPVHATYLSFTAHPTHTLAGSVMAPVRVVATDQHGTFISRFSGDVTVALSTSQSGGTLSGTRTVRAVNGVASFTDLRVDGVGSGFSLVATTGCCAAPVQSETFDVVSSQLAFIAQPTPTAALAIMTPPIQVAARDLSGHLLSDFTGAITIALGANSPSGYLLGTLTKPAVNGVATFSDLSIDGDGNGYTLNAAAAGFVNATSSGFTILHPWMARAPMPTSRADLGVGVVNGVLYAVGGWAVGSTDLAVVEAYDPATNGWTTKAPMATGRAFSGIGVVGGILYAVGGMHKGAASAVVEAYDPSTNQWTTKAAMPTARYGLAVGVVDGILYAVGGRIQNGQANDPAIATVEAYDPVTNQWTTRAPMVGPRAFAQVVAANGILYAIGGDYEHDDDFTSPHSTLHSVSAYDPASNQWTPREWMPTGRVNHASAVVGGVIYAIGGGGYDYYYVLRPTVHGYDVATNRWMTKPSLPGARAAHAAGVIDGVIYVVGGYFDDQTLTQLLAYRP